VVDFPCRAALYDAVPRVSKSRGREAEFALGRQVVVQATWIAASAGAR
jgi:hypothetical protein